MRKPKSKFLVISLLFSMVLPASSQAANHSIFNGTERVVYFLDVSASSDARQLWKFLRSSLFEKLETSLGAPNRNGIAKPRKPIDLSLSIINDNSQSAPVIEIVSSRDAATIWGVMINSIGGGNPSGLRMKDIEKDFFGSTGAYPTVVREFVTETEDGQIKIFPISACQKKAEVAFKKGNFMSNVRPTTKVTEAARDICKVVLKMAKGITAADALFVDYKCEGKCSDVVGAVQRAQAVVADEVRNSNGTAKVCIAIASDMLNSRPNLSPGSPWLTLSALKNSTTVVEAESKGKQVAEEASIRFNSRAKIRVEVIGQGGGTGFPPDLRAKLDAFWNGFWKASGIKSQSQQASLDQACK